MERGNHPWAQAARKVRRSLHHDREEVAARAALGEETFAWAEGQAMTPKLAVEYALRDEADA